MTWRPLLALLLNGNALDNLLRQLFESRCVTPLPIFPLGDIRKSLSVGYLGGVRLTADTAFPINSLEGRIFFLTLLFAILCNSD
jgi:hypothetical protein